jgi:hypothetical protein
MQKLCTGAKIQIPQGHKISVLGHKNLKTMMQNIQQKSFSA